jgi:ubiquinone/menaquinone biosynthesis C-methylase UbiE
MGTSVDELYGDFWRAPRPAFDDLLATSLQPRGSGLLMEVFRATGAGPTHTVLDVGCRDAGLGIDLARTFGCRVVAVDPIESHIQDAERRVAEAGLAGQVRPIQGHIETLPLGDESVDRIWCRDMLNHVDLPAALSECFRVLRPGGAMVVFQTLATELLEPREATRFCAALAIVPENMSCERFERTATETGFRIVRKEAQGSESREYSLESGGASFDATLLGLARMRRLEDELVAQYGRAFYEASYAGDLWGIYQMLGKLFNYIHVLERPSGDGAPGTSHRVAALMQRWNAEDAADPDPDPVSEVPPLSLRIPPAG